MPVTMNPYLNFAGNTREAMEFYHSIFGGDLTVDTFSSFGVTDMPADGVMHAALVTSDFTLMASDAMPGAEATWGGTRNYICLGGTNAEQLTGWFEKLADGGNIGMPLEPQSWGATFGLCMDRYGIEWMVNIYPAG
ncbi:VOC family protein [Tessaracoccus sp. HDW20]|uniref:VOC family protein n=1 Tax=Tessaracoccus coleopterorum TaxID=2714950 RepID=UPI0018D27B2F|nr:VOC family protein [Tessaracoccus coleopterorum]NHB85059.1 VOC family protein [Tessaracoccus coleopterorum]